MICILISMKLFLFLIMLSSISLADTLSAYRNPLLPFSYYQQIIRKAQESSAYREDSVINSARPYKEGDLIQTTRWGSIAQLQTRFSKMRNIRSLDWKKRLDFPRRISWLYPKDGCFARASMANRFFFHEKVPVPGKIFVFGSLAVNTRNNKSGRATWWFHVAPIVQVSGVKYVLDPALEPTGPLLLKDWLSRMGNPSSMKIAICGSGAYSPEDHCRYETDGNERQASRSQSRYLDLEWKNLQELGRIPEHELGHRPPWF